MPVITIFVIARIYAKTFLMKSVLAEDYMCLIAWVMSMIYSSLALMRTCKLKLDP